MSRTLLFLALATAAGAQVSDGGRLDTGVRLPCADCGASVYGRRDTANCADSIARRVTPIALQPLDVADKNARSTTLPPDRPGWWQRHLGDTAIHLGATSLDAASSWGRGELNPLLRSADGRFGARGLGIKLAVFGAVEGTKWLILRRGERGRWVRSLSLGPAVAFGGVAARNWRNR